MKRFLRPALLAIAIAVGMHTVTGPVHATGIPVFDAGNLSQNLISALQAMLQTAKQIQQYQTQLEQYRNMLQNTTAPVANVWDAAQNTMDGLRRATDTLQHYKNTLGSLDNYLGRFHDTAGYRQSPCFSGGRCSQADWDALSASQELGSQAQKRSNDALFRAIDQQQDALQSDARQLERLQSAAQGASGQMQAIGYANQLASQQANQLLQIRALMVAEQNALAARNQAQADREALARAADARVLAPRFEPSVQRSW
ncbi:P-type conjugative transfer protein TrbJ [Pseudoduganella lurida]|uniref:P-type conjugative transfer protein TrbJ n=1 Tax=Pseudoduganella lurida TaxID=1036180 RepID=A0A562R0H1_9BURK|nr:P-type conjugative transfer protein TrbJ [Pseudoduganella lurida]TWI62551.1 P-type conjugative transfer protein TrbJ [Pseudoduganella lurida]